MARSRRRPPSSTLAKRWLAVVAVVLIGYAYYHPLRSWMSARQELSSRRHEVRQLAAERRALAQRLQASTGVDALTREARRLGYIRPGEHLFIVKGIAAWEKARTTIEGNGK